jgi:hypothetical protein
VDRPGVRVILVYPLNALANDQMHRIARLLYRDLRDPGITLGRFTGQVRSGSTRAEEEARLIATPRFQTDFDEARHAPRNWLLSRAEMLDSPPHILITNYAMLEHVPLLPRNRALISGADVRWLVLDEIHTYTGAQAIEVAFLIRKLKARLEIAAGNIRCVGTSASLDPARSEELARFAENLFGEPFASGESSVITAGRQLHPALTDSPPASPLLVADWIAMGRVLSSLRAEGLLLPENAAELLRGWNREIGDSGLEAFAIAEDVASFGDGLIPALARQPEVRAVASALEGRTLPFEFLAAKIFSETTAADAQAALTALVSLGVLAKPALSGAFPCCLPDITWLRLASRGWPCDSQRPSRSLGRHSLSPAVDNTSMAPRPTRCWFVAIAASPT